MLMTKDNEVSLKSNKFLELGVMSVIGDRNEQQDCFGYYLDDRGLLICICDGMGGYSGGSEASKIAVRTVLEKYRKMDKLALSNEFLLELTKLADQKVCELHDSNVMTREAGTTLVMIYIKDNMLYWNSVGDSRLYILRNQDFLQITKDQNYHTVLKEKRNAGEITDEEFVQDLRSGNALINYVGIGNLELIDHNVEPLVLKRNDQLLLCTDGLYKLLKDNDICAVLCESVDIKTKLQMFEISMRRKAQEFRIKRDNATTSLIKLL